jgi:type VI secretion system Hcp family effector
MPGDPSRAIDAYLRLSQGSWPKGEFNVPGDSRSRFHRGWMEVHGFGHGVSWALSGGGDEEAEIFQAMSDMFERAADASRPARRPPPRGASGSVTYGMSKPGDNDLATPQITHADMTFSKRLDSATPMLWLGASSGAKFGAARLELCRSVGSTPYPYLVIELKNVRLLKAEFPDSLSEGLPEEKLTLGYEQIHWLYLEWNDNGTVARKVFYAYDQIKNASVAFDNTIVQEMTPEKFAERKLAT